MVQTSMENYLGQQLAQLEAFMQEQRQFLIDVQMSKPTLSELNLMDNIGKTSFDWPKRADTDQMPLHKKVRLERIAYEHGEGLNSIQLQFSNGLKTPFFNKAADPAERAEAAKTVTTVEIDPTKPIRKVCLQVAKVGVADSTLFGDKTTKLFGLRLLDGDDKTIAEVNWGGKEGYEWSTSEVPEGQEIIGVFGNTSQGGLFGESSAGGHITGLGFRLWTPSPYAE